MYMYRRQPQAGGWLFICIQIRTGCLGNICTAHMGEAVQAVTMPKVLVPLSGVRVLDATRAHWAQVLVHVLVLCGGA
jgi:hypothetical protein